MRLSSSSQKHMIRSICFSCNFLLREDDDIRCFPFSTSELFSYFTVMKHCFSLCMCDLSALSPIVLISISLSQVLQKHLCLSALNSDNHGLKSSLLSHLIKKSTLEFTRHFAFFFLILQTKQLLKKNIYRAVKYLGLVRISR